MHAPDDFKSILSMHFARYPFMQPQDAVKLAYQSAFGGGHMVTDVQASLRRMREELHACKRGAAYMPLIEPAGNGFCRVNLPALQAHAVSAEALNLAFAYAPPPDDGAMVFQHALAAIHEMAANGSAPFSSEAFEAYQKEYRQAGAIRPVSHSEQYRGVYTPSYRVLPEFHARLLTALTAIERRMAQGGTIMLAIDGPCGAGKTALAHTLKEMFHAQVIPMDAFFLPVELRTAERLATAGGNIHYERFLEEVAGASGHLISYRPYDCATGAYKKPVQVQKHGLIIVEGSYSLHPVIAGIYGCSIFLDVSPETQNARLYRRETRQQYDRYIAEWMPMENAYFEACLVRERAGFVVTNDSLS